MGVIPMKPIFSSVGNCYTPCTIYRKWEEGGIYNSAAHSNTIIWSTMVSSVTYKNAWNVASGAISASIILTSTGEPWVVLWDMNLTIWPNVAQWTACWKMSLECLKGVDDNHTWNDGNEIFFVCNMCEIDIGINIVSESLVADLSIIGTESKDVKMKQTLGHP